MEATSESNPQIQHDEDSNEEWDLWDPKRDDYESSLNSLALGGINDPMSFLTGKRDVVSSSRFGNLTVCEHYLRYGRCADGDNCSRLHVEPHVRQKLLSLQSHFERNKDRVCVNYTYLSPENFQVDENVLLLVSVTNPKRPNDFYFVSPYESLDVSKHSEESLDFMLDSLKTNSAFKRNLDNTHHQLEALFDHDYRVDNVNEEIYVSQIVACKLKNGFFRRAMVLSAPRSSYEDSDYKLLLIDTGAEVELPRESIYDIKARNLSDPPMALKARLNLKPSDKQCDWSTEALELFSTIMKENQYLFCKILEYSDIDQAYTVDLFDRKKRESLTDKLVENRLAERCAF